MNTATEYFIVIDGKDEGPFNLQQLRAMLSNGEISPATQISVPGWKEWLDLQSVLNVNEPTPKRPMVGIPMMPRLGEEPAVVMGLIGMALGMVLLLIAWFAKTAVETASSLTGAVVNLGMLSDRELAAISGGSLLVVGAVLVLVGVVNFHAKEIAQRLKGGK